ncbi:3',5'-cyclic adenosine monophosphate phosphodiesterase CpdA [Abditibacteriota bacterium]|nr:3',5'-cyclic adenosine monophosphate phosphodiesterase CpdA [Abditibacteriota bacterium]
MIRPVTAAPSSIPQNSDKLTVLPFSDLHLPKPQAQTILANRDYLNRADYVVFLGDMVRAYATLREYGDVRAFVGQLERPFTAVAGNHEFFFTSIDDDSPLYGEIWEQANDDEERMKLRRFLEFWRLESLWRAFDSPLGRFVFLSLDAVGHWKQEVLSDPQLAFLEKQLGTDKPLFIWCHAPLVIEARLDLVYYDEERSASIEPTGTLKSALLRREAPTFWMSGHIHLHPSHYLFPPYRAGGNVWQIHCPDSRSYGRLLREHRVPQFYEGVFSRHLEIDASGVSFVTHSHAERRDLESYRVDF